MSKYAEYVSRIANADPRADDGQGNWKAYPVTSVGCGFRCWIGRTRPEITCGITHRKESTAECCAERLARVSNLQEQRQLDAQKGISCE